jgi:hypothetical protein
MLKTTLKFENHGSSGIDFIGYGVDFEVPGNAIGDAAVSVSVPTEHIAAITAAVQAKRPAMVITEMETIDDGIEPDYVPVDKTPVNAVAASGTLTVGSGGSKILDGDTVTIGSKTYTFKTALTPTEGQVLIGANDTAALLNLKNAINHTGTPDTDYKCAAVHPTVTGTSSNATTLVVTAKTKGVAGNSIVTTETEAGTDKAWGAAHLEGGVNGTPGIANETCMDDTYLYCCITANTIADANWRRIALGSAY